jgi:hypothetical protein
MPGESAPPMSAEGPPRSADRPVAVASAAAGDTLSDHDHAAGAHDETQITAFFLATKSHVTPIVESQAGLHIPVRPLGRPEYFFIGIVCVAGFLIDLCSL